MATLSFAELRQLLLNLGATSDQADTGAAIALAESGGRTDAAGDVGLGGSGPTSFGPWQIHLPAHPGVSLQCAEDPVCAARQVQIISNNFTSWTAWTTFNTGAFRQFLSGGSGGSGSASSGGGGGAQTMSSGGSSDQFTIATLPVVGDVTVPKQPIIAVLADVGAAIVGLVLVVLGIRWLLGPRLQSAAAAPAPPAEVPV